MQNLDRKTGGKKCLSELGVDEFTALKLVLKNCDRRLWSGLIYFSSGGCKEIL